MKIQTDMDLQKTLFCGQFFRSQVQEDGYEIFFRDKRIFARKDQGNLLVQGQVSQEEIRDFFDLDRDYKEVEKALRKYSFLKEPLDLARGIHLLRQDLWEVIITFILSANSNIPRIRKSLFALCQNYGPKLEDDFGPYYGFPQPEDLRDVRREDFREKIKVGYRDQYLEKTTKLILAGQVNLEDLKKTDDPQEALKDLMKLSGVGEKVAHCILLFGLHNWRGFPVDVWMRRILKENFPGRKESDYQELAQTLFGPYAGFAQQTLFYYAKTQKMGGKKE